MGSLSIYWPGFGGIFMTPPTLNILQFRSGREGSQANQISIDLPLIHLDNSAKKSRAQKL